MAYEVYFYPTLPLEPSQAVRCVDLDKAYALINGYGATDNAGNICRPLFELVEVKADGTRCVLDCRREG